MDKTRARRDLLCPYLKIKLTEPLLNNSLDKYFPPPFWSYIIIYLYTNVYTYMILWIFKFLCAKSKQISKKLLSWRRGHRQMFIVLNFSAVLYSNLIGQRQVFVSNTDQPKALLEHGQNWSPGPNFDHFPQSEWSLINKRRITAKWNQRAKVWPNTIERCCYVLI